LGAESFFASTFTNKLARCRLCSRLVRARLGAESFFASTFTNSKNSFGRMGCQAEFLHQQASSADLKFGRMKNS